MKTKTKVLLIVLAVAVLMLTGYANRLQNARLQKTLALLSAIPELLGICFPDSSKPQLTKETLMEFYGTSSSTSVSVMQ
jgi:hypothetical protein